LANTQYQDALTTSQDPDGSRKTGVWDATKVMDHTEVGCHRFQLTIYMVFQAWKS